MNNTLADTHIAEIIASMSVMKVERFQVATQIADQRNFLLFLGPYTLRVKRPKMPVDKYVIVRLLDGKLDIPELGITLNSSVVRSLRMTQAGRHILDLHTTLEYDFFTSENARWCKEGLAYYINPMITDKVIELIDEDVFTPNIMSKGNVIVRSLRFFKGSYHINNNTLLFDGMGMHSFRAQFNIAK